MGELMRRIIVRVLLSDSVTLSIHYPVLYEFLRSSEHMYSLCNAGVMGSSVWTDFDVSAYSFALPLAVYGALRSYARSRILELSGWRTARINMKNIVADSSTIINVGTFVHT